MVIKALGTVDGVRLAQYNVCQQHLYYLAEALPLCAVHFSGIFANQMSD